MLQLLGMQVDEVISQAQATKGPLAAQHSAFMEIQGKLKQLGDHFPVIHSLLGKLVGKIGIHILFLNLSKPGVETFSISQLPNLSPHQTILYCTGHLSK
jgi:hypothetical protein